MIRTYQESDTILVQYLKLVDENKSDGYVLIQLKDIKNTDTILLQYFRLVEVGVIFNLDTELSRFFEEC